MAEIDFVALENLRWDAGEFHCAMEFLDKINVPRQDEKGRTYSIVGRICELMRQSEPYNYPERMLSESDFSNYILNKAVNDK